MLREKSEPLLRNLMRATVQTVHMAVLEFDQATLIAKLSPGGAPRVATWIGKRVELHCTALGKCLMAWRTQEEREQMVRDQNLLRHNENTIVSIYGLRRELARIREAGYAVDDEEEEIGMRCVGVPVFDAQNRVTFALSVSGTIQEIDLLRIEEIAKVAQITAESLAHLLDSSDLF